MDGVNHEALLRKYIGHVVAWEGVDFLDERYRRVGRRHECPDDFTDAQWAELQRLRETPTPNDSCDSPPAGTMPL